MAWKLAEETERDRPEAVRRPGENGSVEAKECVSFRKQNRTGCSKSCLVSVAKRTHKCPLDLVTLKTLAGWRDVSSRHATLFGGSLKDYKIGVKVDIYLE